MINYRDLKQGKAGCTEHDVIYGWPHRQVWTWANVELECNCLHAGQTRSSRRDYGGPHRQNLRRVTPTSTPTPMSEVASCGRWMVIANGCVLIGRFRQAITPREKGERAVKYSNQSTDYERHFAALFLLFRPSFSIDVGRCPVCLLSLDKRSFFNTPQDRCQRFFYYTVVPRNTKNEFDFQRWRPIPNISPACTNWIYKSVNIVIWSMSHDVRLKSVATAFYFV